MTCPTCNKAMTSAELAAYRRCENCYVGRCAPAYMPSYGEGHSPYRWGSLRGISNNISYAGHNEGRIIRKGLSL